MTKSVLSKLFMRASQFVMESRGASLRVREAAEDASTAPAATLTGSQLEALHLLLDVPDSRQGRL